ncbi:hypothetical protein [Winogradskyella sp.]|uniref:hypothetical protein n=1 Tax=Winogradskyella sp. TaxID=1883156 RepID=UPI003AB114CF
METELKNIQYYEDIYEENPEREKIRKEIREAFPKDIQAFHKEFVTLIQYLRRRARDLNMPIKIRPEIDSLYIIDSNGFTITPNQVCNLRQMFEEAAFGNTDYL